MNNPHENLSPILQLLRNRIDLHLIPFSERGSRLMLFHNGDHFSIKLAERWFKLDHKISGYRQRPPLLDDWQFTDADNRPLKLALTTYPHCIICDSEIGSFTITYVDAETLLIILPPARCGLTFRAHFNNALQDRRGGVLRLIGEIRRNAAYTTNARILRNEALISAEEELSINISLDATAGSRVLMFNVTPRLGFNRWLPEPYSTLEKAARRWDDWFALAPRVAEQYRSQYYYAWWVMRAGLISTRFYTTREAMTPSKVHYVGIWQWDNFFHSLAYRYVEPRLAQDQLRLLLDHQREDGMIPDAIHDEGTVTHLTFPVEADVTKPPLIAWAAWKLYELDGDREFLDEIYEPLVRWNRWWLVQNDLDNNGLCEYQHPFSSGLDNSPLWDDGMPVEAPDLNTYICLQMEALSKIARVIGAEEDASHWEQKAEQMARRLIELQWDEEAGLFWARRHGQRIDVRTPFNLFPLITGRMPRDISDRLVSHLKNEHEFWPLFPIPSVAIDDPKFNPLEMWRGPTWVNINYLFIEGLERSGYSHAAQELRMRTLKLLAGKPDLYEYYNPLSGENPPHAASIFGWSAAIYINLAIQATEALKRQE